MIRRKSMVIFNISSRDFNLLIIKLIFLLIMLGCVNQGDGISKDSFIKHPAKSILISKDSSSDLQAEKILLEISLPQGCVLGSLSPGNEWVVFHCVTIYGEPALPVGTWLRSTNDDARQYRLSDGSDYNSNWSPNSELLLLNFVKGPLIIFDADDWENSKNVLSRGTKSLTYFSGWAPDGSCFAVTDPDVDIILSLMDPQGNQDVLLWEDETTWSTWKTGWKVYWSPDGKHLSYTSIPEYDSPHKSQIWKIDISSKQHNLLYETDDHYIFWELDWSPDSKQLVYASTSDTEEPFVGQIWLINAQSKNRKVLYEARNVILRNPAWSPDGKKIAFEGPEKPNLSIINLRTNEVLEIEFEVSQYGGVERFFWSPDGTKLVIETTSETWLVTANGKEASIIKEDFIRWNDEHSLVVWDRAEEQSTVKVISVEID